VDRYIHSPSSSDHPAGSRQRHQNNLASKAQVQSATAAVETSKAQIRAANATIQAAQAALETARLNLDLPASRRHRRHRRIAQQQVGALVSPSTYRHHGFDARPVKVLVHRQRTGILDFNRSSR